MSDSAALDSFLDKWRARWPEWSVGEIFVVPERRDIAVAWFALLQEFDDVPGDALQLVVIDKLPFPPPGDPLVQARSLRLQQAGRSPFKDYALPEAAVALKQGAGRLIRHESDAGLLVIGDTRLVKMGYGKRLLAALPPMRRLQSEQEFYEALDRLTRTSTTDRSCP